MTEVLIRRGEKRCVSCLAWWPLTSFHGDPCGALGRRNECRGCRQGHREKRHSGHYWRKRRAERIANAS